MREVGGLHRSPLAPSKHVALLQDVGNGVERHVDCGVGEGLDEELWVPGHAGAQAKRPGARPLVEPAEGVLEGVQHSLVVQVHALQRPLSLLAPLLLAVCDVPAQRSRHRLLAFVGSKPVRILGRRSPSQVPQSRRNSHAPC